MHFCPKSGAGARLNVIDVSARRLPPSGERITKMLATIPVAAYMQLVRGYHNILYVNRAFTTLLGYTPEEVVGYSACCVFIDEEVERLCSTALEAETGTDLYRMESRFRSKAGKTFFVELTRQLYDIEGRVCEKNEPAEWSVVYIHDVTAAKEYERIANDQERRITNCVQVLSHEFRTPLNAIIGFSELLRSRCAGDKTLPPTFEKYMEYVYNSAQLLLQLIELEIECLESKKYRLAERPIPLEEALESVMSMQTIPASEKRVALHCNNACSDTLLHADPFLLKMMLTLLVTNAIFFNKVGGRADIESRIEDGGIVITVHDTGIGISPENLCHIFTLHFKEAPMLSEGKGLSLFLVKKYMDLHGGEAGVRSELGKGSSFWLRFPPARTVRPGTG